MLRLLLAVLFAASTISAAAGKEGYKGNEIEDLEEKETFVEDLVLTPLPQVPTPPASITHTPTSTDRHYDVFPRTVAELVDKHHAQEVHVTLTQGRWRPQQWGLPTVSAPPGAEIWAWFKNETESVDISWRGLLSSLSGLLCSSLNFITASSTGRPCWSFAHNLPHDVMPLEGHPQGLLLAECKSGQARLRYATLPQENLCTENLTPWIKLLPCRNQAGLASLLNAIRVFDAHYVSLALHLRPVCMDASCTHLRQELVQTLSVVLPSSRPTAEGITLDSLFDRPLETTCGPAMSSRVYYREAPGYTSVDGPDSIASPIAGGAARYWDTATLIQHPGLRIQSTAEASAGHVRPAVISLSRFLSGYGHEKGGITALIRNHGNTPISVAYYDLLPSQLQVFAHTLKVGSIRGNVPLQTQVVRKKRFVPQVHHRRPFELELFLDLPANSTTSVSIEFRKPFLKLNEHAPDANRGLDVGACVVEAHVSGNESDAYPGLDWSPQLYQHVGEEGQVVRLHSNVLLVPIPLPDFSMPYNVIVITCTLMALSFGFVFNMSFRVHRITKPEETGGLAAQWYKQWRKARLGATTKGKQE